MGPRQSAGEPCIGHIRQPGADCPDVRPNARQFGGAPAPSPGPGPWGSSHPFQPFTPQVPGFTLSHENTAPKVPKRTVPELWELFPLCLGFPAETTKQKRHSRAQGALNSERPLRIPAAPPPGCVSVGQPFSLLSLFPHMPSRGIQARQRLAPGPQPFTEQEPTSVSSLLSTPQPSCPLAAHLTPGTCGPKGLCGHQHPPFPVLSLSEGRRPKPVTQIPLSAPKLNSLPFQPVSSSTLTGLSAPLSATTLMQQKHQAPAGELLPLPPSGQLLVVLKHVHTFSDILPFQRRSLTLLPLSVEGT